MDSIYGPLMQNGSNYFLTLPARGARLGFECAMGLSCELASEVFEFFAHGGLHRCLFGAFAIDIRPQVMSGDLIIGRGFNSAAELPAGITMTVSDLTEICERCIKGRRQSVFFILA